MIKKGLAWIILGSLLLGSLVGCGKGINGEKAEKASTKKVEMGRYIEQEVNIEGFAPEATTFLVKTKDNRIQVYQQGQEGVVVFEEQDDLSWKKIEPEWLKDFNETYGFEWLCCMALDDKDQPYFVRVGEVDKAQNEETDSSSDEKVSEEKNADKEEQSVEDTVMNTRTTIIAIKDGKLETCQLKIEGDLGYIIPKQMVILGENDIVVAGDYLEQTHYNLETGKEVNKYAKTSSHALYKDQKLYTLNLDEKKIEVYNTEDNGLEQEFECKEIDESSIPLFKDDKGIYLVSKQGIMYYVGEGEISEKLIESTGLSLGLPSYGLENCVEKDGRFLTLMVNDQYQHVLRQYVYSETTPTLPTVELSAYCLEDNKSVQEALIAYQLAHPEVRIQLQRGVNEESGITKADAIKALNTEILAKKGPDILVLDGLPVDTYIEKGVLSKLEAMTQQEELFSFIKQPFIRKDSLYAVPLRFTVPVLWGNKEILEKADNLEALAQYKESHKDQTVLFELPVDILINRFASGYEKEWFNEKGELQEQALISFLEKIYVFMNKEALEDESSHNIPTDGLLDYVFGEVKVYDSHVGSVLDLLTGNAGNARKGDGSFSLIKDDGKRFCIPNSIMAINAASPNKKEGQAVIDFMLEERVQLIDTKEGFPTRMKAMEKWINGDTTNKGVSYGMGRSMTEVLSVEWGYEKELKDFYEEVKQIQEVKMEDKELLQMIIEGSKPYFKGEKSVEEVVSALKPQLELYKQE